jgi:molecular chaperone Hsp33
MQPEDVSHDFVQPFQVERPGLRGRLVRLGPVVDAVLAPHAYPPPVAALLAKSLALGAVLASGLKFDGVFSLQLQGDGPVSLVVVDISSGGDMRGYARFATDRLRALEGGGEPSFPRLMGAGYMAFTVDQGPGTDRYQGITALEGGSLGDCAHTYFRQSEQIRTAIHLCAARRSAPPAAVGAAALMIQRLSRTPDDDEADENWRRAVVLMSSVTTGELLSASLSPADVLFRLFHEDGVRLYRRRSLRHRCRCSRARVDRLLATFPRAELEAMAEDGRVTVTCEFCKTTYTIDVTGGDVTGAT